MKNTKRLLAMLLVIAMLVANVPALTVHAAEENEAGFAGGSGTASDPYQISTYEQLQLMKNYMSSSFILTNDINVTSDWKYSSAHFTGTFDGNGYAIIGLNETFMWTVETEGTIKNTVFLRPTNSTGSSDYSASVIAWMNYGTIDGCSALYADIEYTVHNGYNNVTVGGLVGSSSGNILNSYFHGNITITGGSTSAYFGGIVGSCFYSNSLGKTVKNCANYATIIVDSSESISVGGIVGQIKNGTSIINCYNAGDIVCKTKMGSVGGIVAYAYNDTPVNFRYSNNKVTNCYNLCNIQCSSGFNEKGPIKGYTSYTDISKCYSSGIIQNNSATTESVSDANMQNQETFESYGFDFTSTWCFDVGYPYPQLQANPHFSVPTAPTSDEILANSITLNAVEGYEYSMDGTNWQDSPLFTGLEAVTEYTFYQRSKKCIDILQDINMSEVANIKTAKNLIAAPEKPVLEAITSTSVTLQKVDKMEYSLDGITWQDSNVFENLNPNKEYSFYQRIVENDTDFASACSEATVATTERYPLSGSVTITGTARYGDTLTADVSNVLPENATYSYEWKANGVVIGTDGTYKITKDDIGKNITVLVKGTDDFIGTLTSASVTATKTTVQLPNAPVAEEVTNTTVKLIEKAGYEYSKDGVVWQDSSLFEGLSAATEYTFYQRAKETDTTFASKTSSGAKVTTLKNTVSAPEKPVVSKVTNTAVTLTAINGYEYSMDGLTWQKSNVFTGLSPNTEYAFCQRIAENSTDYASAQSGYAIVVTLKNSVTAPAAPKVQAATASSVTLKATSGYEYSMDGTTWQKSNVFNGLTVLETYNFYQRVAETGTDYASPASTALNFKVKNVAPKTATPVLKGKTNNKIEVEAVTGCEYSIDGQNWTTNTVFGSLKPNTTYSIYARTPETDTHYSGEISNALTVTTLKNTVSTPAAPVLSDRTSNSITLVSNSAYEYSKNGTTWQDSNVFTGLSPNTEYTFYQRVAETSTSYASEKSAALKVYTLKNSVSAPSAPTLSAKTATSVTLVKKNGYEYSKDGMTWQASNAFEGLNANTEYSFYQRVAETSTAYASPASTALKVTTPKKEAPAVKPVVAMRVTATSVTLAPYTGYEYSKDGTTWQKSNVFSGLTANTAYKFYQRGAETADTNASASSAACNVTTSAKSACSVSSATPIVAEITTNKVVLVERPGYEYSKNGTTWQASNTFTGLSSNTSYTFYQRIAETGSELASAKSTGVTVKTLKTASGTTAATNYDRLRSYISSYGTTGSNGNKSIVQSSTTSGGLTIYYSLEDTSSGIEFALLTAQNTSTKLVGQTEFVLSRSSTYISVYSSMLYYYSGSLADSASGTKSINRATYSASTTYSFYQSGSIITGSDFSENFNTTMELLCTYWDNYIYSNLGFGLKGLGFTSFSGKGSTVCDPLASYHTGTTETRNAYVATCTTNGYTGDTYCTNCGEKKASGSVVTCNGSHTYTNACDNTCNTCGEERVIEHQYSNVCDTTCNICNHTRTAIEHIFDNACDETCNGCSEKRKAPHAYDDSKDLICNDCGYERPPYLAGDLDGDDEITDWDGVLLARYLAGWTVEIVDTSTLDIDGDGEVTDWDGVILDRYLAGWNVTIG